MLGHAPSARGIAMFSVFNKYKLFFKNMNQTYYIFYVRKVYFSNDFVNVFLKPKIGAAFPAKNSPTKGILSQAS